MKNKERRVFKRLYGSAESFEELPWHDPDPPKLLVKALEYADASAIQPFNFFLLAWATLIGITMFGERPGVLAIVGTVIIVGAGLFAIFRERALKGG